MKLRTARESVGWMDSEGPLTESPGCIRGVSYLNFSEAQGAHFSELYEPNQGGHTHLDIHQCEHERCRRVREASVTIKQARAEGVHLIMGDVRVKRFVIPLTRNNWLEVIGLFPLTDEEWGQMMSTLHAMRLGLVEQPGSAPAVREDAEKPVLPLRDTSSSS